MNDPVAAFLYARSLVPEDWTEQQICARAEQVKDSLQQLDQALETVASDTAEEEVQRVYYDMGKIHFSTELRWWFRVLYQIMLKQDDGPRLGQFTIMVTPYWVQDRLRQALEDPWRINS